MKIIKGGVTAAKGFEAAGAAAGIKYKGRTDMALIYSQTPCAAAGTFTRNIVKAAPVKWDQQILGRKGKIHAVVVNAGIANACTGKEGLSRCEDTAAAAAWALHIKEDSVLVSSTGVIGKQLPMDKLIAGIGLLAKGKSDTKESGTKAAEAILTTDTCTKELAAVIEAGGRQITIGGMAKGSGMIHPNMCTMLAFITTDAVIAGDTLQKALSEDVENTYNMISVDGDTSTNDTVLLLANGQAGNAEILYGSAEYEKFTEALHAVNRHLAKKIAGDGEGATALFEVKAVGCESIEQAKTLAKAVVCSNLTKTALAGHDANWGRILCAMGYSGARFHEERVDLFFESKAGRLQIIADGKALDYNEEEAARILSEPEVTALVDVKMGSKEAAAWGCDLTEEYVKINASYRS